MENFILETPKKPGRKKVKRGIYKDKTKIYPKEYFYMIIVELIFFFYWPLFV